MDLFFREPNSRHPRNFNELTQNLWRKTFDAKPLTQTFLGGWCIQWIFSVKNFVEAGVRTCDLPTHFFVAAVHSIKASSWSRMVGTFLAASTLGDLTVAAIATVLVAGKHTQSLYILKDEALMSLLKAPHYQCRPFWRKLFWRSFCVIKVTWLIN